MSQVTTDNGRVANKLNQMMLGKQLTLLLIYQYFCLKGSASIQYLQMGEPYAMDLSVHSLEIEKLLLNYNEKIF